MENTGRLCLIFAIAATLHTATDACLSAQQLPMQRGAFQPRAIADSTFAAALAVNDLAEEIRRGTLSQRTHDEPALRQAIEQLSDAGAERKRPEFLDKVPLWDFAFDSLTFEGAQDGDLLVTARAHFSRDSSSAQRVTLRLKRKGTEWAVVGYGRLREYFDDTRQKAKGGKLK